MSIAIWSFGSFSAPPTMSGTATAPAYMTRTCWRPRRVSRVGGRTSSTGWTPFWFAMFSPRTQMPTASAWAFERGGSAGSAWSRAIRRAQVAEVEDGRPRRAPPRGGRRRRASRPARGRRAAMSERYSASDACRARGGGSGRRFSRRSRRLRRTRVIRKASPFASANPSASIQNLGLSRYGAPEVGQKVTQLPHSLQASPRLTIWIPCSTESVVVPLGTARPPSTTNDGKLDRERRHRVRLVRAVRADGDAEAADLVAVEAAGRLAARGLGVEGEEDLGEAAALGDGELGDVLGPREPRLLLHHRGDGRPLWRGAARREGARRRGAGRSRSPRRGRRRRP